MFSSNTSQVADGGYQISRSLRFNSADSTNVQRTFSTTGTSQTTSTLSMWFKRGSLNVNQRIFDCYDGSSGSSTGIFLDNDNIRLDYGRGSGAYLITTAVYRDPSAWYHIVAVMDSTNATSSNRMRLWVNGVQVTAFSTAIYPSQNALNNWMSANSNNRIGSAWDGSSNFSGYITEVNFIDGQALSASSFGEFNAQTGVWQPKAYSGSYGTNGFYVNFSDNSNTTAATLGKDYSGNGNNWTPNNFSVSAGAGNDSLVDTPTPYGSDTGAGGQVRGNYATLNPLNATPSPSISNGNLYQVSTTSGHMNGSASTIAMSSGKWYAEVVFTRVAGSTDSYQVGLADAAWQAERLDAGGWYGRFWYFSTGYAYVDNGNKNTSNSASSYGASYTHGDVIGIAFDADAGTLTFYKNGTSQGTAFTGITGAKVFAASCYKDASITLAFDINFGQRPFAYTAPSGFKALCTQNLPTPTIGATTATQAGKFFNPVLYTGNSTVRSITGVGFQPDFTWIKRRDVADDHYLFDAVRTATKYLNSNLTTAETTNANSLTSFDSDGFGLGISSTTNSNANTFVAWNWKANGAGSTNTAGSITSTVSANTTSGFSVVTWTGTGANATVGHGLGAVPSMIIVKGRGNAYNWRVYHVSTGNDGCTFLNTTAAYGSNSAIWNSTTPTSTVFTIGTDAGVNESTKTFVAYCFAEVPGYSRFGSYTGNGSSDGPFVFCGFRPAYLLIKSSTNPGSAWGIYDVARSTFNVVGNILQAQASDAEVTGISGMDILSNGFKLRDTNSSRNTSGETYIYAAFATHPFKYALAR